MRFLIIIGGLTVASVGAVGLWYLLTNLTFKNENEEK